MRISDWSSDVCSSELLGATSADGKPITHSKEKMDAVSLARKHMASDLNVAVFALAQLSRAVEARGDKRPMRSDLKESGDIEQEADSVILLYRAEHYLEKETADSGAKQQAGKAAVAERARDQLGCR